MEEACFKSDKDRQTDFGVYRAKCNDCVDNMKELKLYNVSTATKHFTVVVVNWYLYHGILIEKMIKHFSSSKSNALASDTVDSDDSDDSDDSKSTGDS